jgi:hypothetical protein
MRGLRYILDGFKICVFDFSQGHHGLSFPSQPLGILTQSSNLLIINR